MLHATNITVLVHILFCFVGGKRGAKMLTPIGTDVLALTKSACVCVCVCVCVNFDWTCWFRVIIYIMCQNTAMKLQTKTKEQFLSQ